MATRGVSLELFNAVRALFERSERALSTREVIDNLRLTAEGQVYDTIRKRVQRAIKYLEDENVVRSIHRDSTQPGVEGRWKRVGRSRAPRAEANGQSPSNPAEIALDLASSFLPPSVYEQIAEPLKHISSALVDSAYRRLFRGRVVVAPREPARLIPKTKPEVVTRVLEAVLTGKPLLVIYDSRSKKGEVSIYLHPLGLVVRDSAIYVVGKTNFADDIRHWALHRFTAVKEHRGSIDRPDGFSLTKWVTDCKMGDYTRPQKVAFWMNELDAHSVMEMKLSRDQKIGKPVNGRVRVEATVQVNDEFTWWLLGYGPKVEVISPKILRTRIHASLKKAAKMYESADE
jgi:predicted DNA-binding transcriptional regulator YafY